MKRVDDNDGQMIFRDLGGLKLPDIFLTGEEKPRKNLTQETYPGRGSNSVRCMTDTHASKCEDYGMKININKTKTMVTGRKPKKIDMLIKDESVK